MLLTVGGGLMGGGGGGGGVKEEREEETGGGLDHTSLGTCTLPRGPGGGGTGVCMLYEACENG